MQMVEIIRRKRDGETLPKAVWQYLIDGVVRGEIPDYQVSAFLMAIYFQGMNAEETVYLTEAMWHSGEVLDLSSIPGIKVDKHSTGGVGDKTTLIALPLAAACGVPIAKMSGRGLGHTGGTIDKLEAIPGFQTTLSKNDFLKQVREIGLAVVGQSEGLVPADKALYALRDVTATVESIPLIASSIMSKKLASGADAIVLDVKVGRGAFMPTLERARALAQAMIAIGERVGRKVHVLLTDMDEPLGRDVGNANEVKEAIEVLSGGGDKRLVDLTVAVAARMVLAAGGAGSDEEAREKVLTCRENGSALLKFEALIRAQGGDIRVIREPERFLPAARYEEEIRAERDGWVKAIDARLVGEAAMLSGAGRETKAKAIDLAAGIHLERLRGERVRAGEVLARLFAGSRPIPQVAVERLAEAFTIGDRAQDEKPLIYDIIDASSP
ncbi:MAG: thymidine phosphorylase [Candidatus Carbobacillus altaicus]|uniref:Pyrimidine-nucleoside phosphorylase n=1 Tax=Candidatus Carbonibacillus altaicus TaxID=2163959 RepID=A0A2R6Y378_9BACL|nr:thymidine phosphorylase [Candidatus Carbobacillus altaicus]PTQ57118.1 MAG: Pyrimidine-nucleoside phosphorylase [Candidatus Carbobacillus altaicus]